MNYQQKRGCSHSPASANEDRDMELSGLGNAPAVRGLLDVQRSEDPDILFLSETKLNANKMERFKWLLGLPCMVARDSEGKGGGVVVFWRRGLNVELRNFSRFHMDLEIKEEDGFKWRFTGMYGEPRTEKKHLTWKLLRILHNQASLLWLCAGDLTEVLFAKGRNEKTQACMGRFREALELCGLEDLGFEGDKFTWRNNNHRWENYIQQRLDRVITNEGWMNQFEGFK